MLAAQSEAVPAQRAAASSCFSNHLLMQWEAWKKMKLGESGETGKATGDRPDCRKVKLVFWTSKQRVFSTPSLVEMSQGVWLISTNEGVEMSQGVWLSFMSPNKNRAAGTDSVQMRKENA